MEYTVDAMHWRASTTNPAGRPPPAGGTGGVPPGSTVAPAVTASFVCEGGPVGATIRDYAPGDKEAVVELSLRAWAPVFRSMEQVLGPEIFVRLHGDWQAFQERAVREVLSDEAMHIWVAEAGGRVVAFAAATLYLERAMGEISMLAVDPANQDRGTGTALTEFVTAWLGEAGERVAMIDTGGDPGHAPARHVYEKAGYTQIPIARYFRAL